MPDPLVLAEGLTRIYGSGATATKALDSVSFQVDRGEFVAIVGKSGSGKSTLLNLLGLLDTPTAGRLRLASNDGAALDRAGRAKLRNEMLGFVFQYHHLLPEFTVMENVLMPALIGGHVIDAALRKRAQETLEVLGLDGLGDKGANDLSGGQKQRVAIGRALMNRPPIVLADEPTGSLDTENTDAVYALFRTINREWGTAFLIVTHDQDIALMTDRILELCDGKLLQDVANEYRPKTGPTAFTSRERDRQ
jgi:lipoprotein-releasing system ATP-binding protein